MQNVGGLFQWLQSEACTPFYDHLTPDNREDIVEQCMSNADFIEAASAFVEDIVVIRQKLETKVGQLCKKMTMAAQQKNLADVTSENVILSQIHSSDLCSNERKPSDQNNIWVDSVQSILPVPENDCICTGIDADAGVDIEKGTHIGSGFYLKREGHLIKMTSPEWTIYY